ncbi:MAG: pantoate--beta-alanine ligase [Rhodospirillales bacterium]|jgi:pantoate--beta-alanine ligase|nr:pantoate--beta-alanine ligase [Rhodospirillales bacterium]MDP6882778.1 pantoate--beta-alanine ligase [Rhodospirillales bacterium]
MSIEVVRTVADLRARLGDWKCDALTVGLVPTMGALHDGHLSLVRRSLAVTGRTCLTLFVNPRQFGAGEDLAQYPRGEAADVALAEAEGAHLVFAPRPEDMYPKGFATQVAVAGLGDILEGEHRPGFFTGVATVVAKLLVQALPDHAFFGDKDYQQLQVIRRLVADLDIPVAIEGCPTQREPDGLALASRNAYLTADERRSAPALYRAISSVAAAVAGGAEAAGACAGATTVLMEAGFSAVDYVTVRDAETLAPVTDANRPARVLAAAHLGQARLIDNVAV